MPASDADPAMREAVALLREIVAEMRASRRLADEAERLIDLRFRRIEERLGIPREPSAQS